MKTKVLNELKVFNTKAMRLAISALCVLFLFVANFLKAPFAPQLIIYLSAILNMRETLSEGFNSLCMQKAGANSLILTGTVFSLLHGALLLDTENLFACSALTLALAALGEYLEERFFEKRNAERSYTDRISGYVLAVALLLFLAVVIIALASGNSIYEALRRSFPIPVLLCTSIVGVWEIAVSAVYTHALTDRGVFLRRFATVEKLGTVKDIICDGRGVVCDDNYSLCDAYSVDADRAWLIAVAAAIESSFNHPFARATVEAARRIDADIPCAVNCFEMNGKGVCGTVLGKKYFLGNKKMLREKKIHLPEIVQKAELCGYLPLYVIENGRFFGMLLFGNKQKSDVDSAVSEFKKLGKRCILIADNEYACTKGNFDILLSEREKVLQEFKKGAKIKAMVISRFPIAKADVVALPCPHDCADVVLGGESMSAALFAVCYGKKAFSVLRCGLIASFAFAVLFAILAALGKNLSPFVIGLVTVAPALMLVRGARCMVPDIVTSEENDMFGKINYTMHIDGMNCAHCSARVKTALETIKGVSAKISLEEKTARIKCPAKVTAEELAKAVTDVGFTVVSTEKV